MEKIDAVGLTGFENQFPNQLSLSAGEYEVYPYFKIEHSYLPTGLVNALGGANMFDFHEDYLNLPCDIEVAKLTVN